MSTMLWLPILMYHRVYDEAPDRDPYGAVTAEQLDETIRYLRRRDYRFVSLDEAFELITAPGKIETGRCVSLTFDDGYRDFYTHAFPVLERHGCPATVFVATDFIGDRNRWDEARGLPSAPLLSREEIVELAGRGVSFGCHGASHRPLTRLSPEERRREIGGARQALSGLLGRDVAFFAYPFLDQDAAVRREVAEAGFRGACGGEQGWNEPFLMHRVDLSRAKGVWSRELRLRGWRYRLLRSLPGRGAAAALRRVRGPEADVPLAEVR